MPIADIGTAREAIYAHFKAGWDAGSAASTLVLYESVANNRKPDKDDPYLKIMVRHNTGLQATLGTENNRRFEHQGTVRVEVYAPAGRGYGDIDVLTRIALDIFEGADTGLDRVTFRNVRANEQGENGGRLVVLVLADFDYQRVR